jgi:membrane protease YdiL (CAAX protease family)
MAHHVLVIGFYFGWTAPETWLFSFAVAIGGAVWAWLYHKSRSLVGPWLSHLLVDAAIFAVGYDLGHVRDETTVAAIAEPSTIALLTLMAPVLVTISLPRQMK